MRACLAVAVLLAATCSVCVSLSPSSYLSKVDKARLAGVFESVWPLSDVRSGHYAAMGLTLLGRPLPDEKAACQLAQKSVSASDVETSYHAAMLAGYAKACALTGLKGIESKLAESLTAEELYQLVATLKRAKVSFDSQKAKSVMEKIVRDDSSASTMAYVMRTAVELGFDKKELAKFTKDIKDVLQQGDEADDQYLYYDKGLFTTAFVAESVVKVMDALGEVPKDVSSEKIYRLANYLLSRKQIYQVKSAAQLLAALKAFADSSVQVPVVVFLKGSATLSKTGQSALSVQLADVWGRPVTDSVAVKVTRAKNQESGAVFMKDAKLTAAASDRSVHSLDFLNAKPTVGFYQLSLTAESAVKKLVFPSSVALEVKVVSTVSVEGAEVWVADRDHHTQPSPVKLQYPAKAAEQLEADSHQRLSLKFQVVLADSKTPTTVHQAFVRLSNKASGKEVIFVTEADKQKVYKFGVDLAVKGKDFDFESGVYSMELIVGDALIENSLVWHVADVKLDLAGEPPKQSEERLSQLPRPEIHHVFRQPDKMAPASLAYAFTLLCVLPLALLLGLWAFLGVNLSGFRPTVSALLFHLGLASILVLYFLYWRCLNMFETLRYLCLLGLPTFFFGNRLLRALAGEKRADA